MSKCKAKREFRKMMKWAICKMFDQNPDVIMPICDLKKELENAWDELIEEGAVIIVDENETT